MRLCPTVEGSPSPLITHRIAAGVCLARQRTNFHKCHKCVYRGKAADWVAEGELELAVNGHAGSSNGVAHQAGTARKAKVLEADA